MSIIKYAKRIGLINESSGVKLVIANGDGNRYSTDGDKYQEFAINKYKEAKDNHMSLFIPDFNLPAYIDKIKIQSEAVKSLKQDIIRNEYYDLNFFAIVDLWSDAGSCKFLGHNAYLCTFDQQICEILRSKGYKLNYTKVKVYQYNFKIGKFRISTIIITNSSEVVSVRLLGYQNFGRLGTEIRY